MFLAAGVGETDGAGVCVGVTVLACVIAGMMAKMLTMMIATTSAPAPIIIKRILLLIIYRAPYFKKVSYSQHSRSAPGYSRGCAAQGMDAVLWDNALCALCHSTPSRGRAPQALARGGVP